MNKGSERRKAYRKAVRVEVQVGLEKAHGLVYFDTSDLSKTGTFLVSDLLLEVGERMTLTFHLPGYRLPFSVRARVVRVNTEPRKRDTDPAPGMGIEFTSMAKEDEAKLERFIHDNSHTPAHRHK
ncbi:MAG: PilZ domain-containing protein [Deltaproteobacteria bacterium]|nr:PilZ domain-containing protein [Deltaproteobacteria bacterium]